MTISEMQLRDCRWERPCAWCGKRLFYGETVFLAETAIASPCCSHECASRLAVALDKFLNSMKGEQP